MKTIRNKEDIKSPGRNEKPLNKMHEMGNVKINRCSK